MTRKQKWLLGLFCLMMVLAWYPLKWKFFPPGGTPMDTSNWKTYCVGRFLIDLPPDAKITIRPGEIWGDKVIWRQDLTPETLHEEVEKKIESLKTTKHEILSGSLFIESFELPNGGVVVHYWGKAYDDSISTMDAYYITPEQRILVQSAKVGRSSFDIGKKLAIELASTLHARDDWDPIPTEPGFCFPGGFSTDTGEWRAEHANLHTELPDYPGIRMAFDLRGTGAKGDTLFEKHSKLTVAKLQATPGINILRYNDVRLGDIAAQEAVMTRINSKGKKLYDFTLQAPSQEKRLDRPQIWLSMNNEFNPYEPREPFTSEAQALGLWDAIKNTIRLRPGAI